MEKKPRLFYYEEGVNAWCPAPERVDEILDVALPDAAEGAQMQVQILPPRTNR